MDRPDLETKREPIVKTRVLLRLVALAACLLSGVGAGPSSAAIRAAGCELEGTFKTTPSLKTDPPARIHYTIRGTANECHWTSGETESGTFVARGSGVASCRGGTTHGVALISWDNHRTSTLRFTTTNVDNVVELEGTFVRGESKGYTAHGALVFVVDVNEPAGCFTEFGLNRATFYGFCERDRNESSASSTAERRSSRLGVR